MSSPAVVWRDDGVIRYVIPVQTLVHTFMATFSRHDKWLCQVVNDFLYPITDEAVAEIYTPDTARLMEPIRLSLSMSHHLKAIEQGRLWSQGPEDKYPGMYYGTMHPVELAALGAHIVEAIEISNEFSTATSEYKKKAFAYVSLWITAAKKFVRPAEEMASIMSGAPLE